MKKSVCKKFGRDKIWALLKIWAKKIWASILDQILSRPNFLTLMYFVPIIINFWVVQNSFPIIKKHENF